MSLFLAVAALRAHGTRATEEFYRFRFPDGRSDRLDTCDGGFVAWQQRTERDGDDAGGGWSEERYHKSLPPSDPLDYFGHTLPGVRASRFFGLHVLTSVDDGIMERQVPIPYWPLLVATALLPGRWLLVRIRRPRRRRETVAHCRLCGYDLRATPHICPECGTAAADGDGPPATTGARSSQWQSRLAAALAAGACVAAVSFALLLAWWQYPRTPPVRDPKVAWCSYDGVWEPCRGTGPDRMSRTDAWGSSAYQALWHHEGEDFLVIIKRTQVFPFSGVAPLGYNVWVFDKAMAVVRNGELSLPPWETPYCLLEVSNPDAPATQHDRDHWRLVIGGRSWARPERSRKIWAAGPDSSGISAASVVEDDPDGGAKLSAYEVSWSDASGGKGAPKGSVSKNVEPIPGLRVRAGEVADANADSVERK